VFGQSYHWSLMQVEYATDCELARNNAPLRGGFRVQSRPL
jgi:hypothetical protein